jgi:ankyrin repeat protein
MVCYQAVIKLEGEAVMRVRRYVVMAIFGASVAAAWAATPAAAQFTPETDRFITAVKEDKGAVATELIRSRPTIVNARDYNGDTGLLIAINRRDEEWTLFLLSQGADPNVAARDGQRPLIAAARLGFTTAVAQLLARNAKVDAENKMGETALIAAVQQRHAPVVRLLLAAGANPDKADSAAGYSARDYAKRDARSREILRLLEANKPKPKA